MGPGGTPYVQYTQLGQYLPAATLSLATIAQQQQACLDATETADSYLRSRYGYVSGSPFILQAWGSDVTRFTAYIAVFLLLSGAVGFAPQAGADRNVTENYYQAVGWPDRPGSGWFPGVASQKITPDVTPAVAVGQNPQADLPQVSSQPLRGWSQLNSRGRPVVG